MREIERGDGAKAKNEAPKKKDGGRGSLVEMILGNQDDEAPSH